MSEPLRLGALISGGGRTLLNLMDRIDAGDLDATVAVVISSRADAAGVARVEARGLPVRVISAEDMPDENDRHDLISRWLAEADVDLVCLCGYVKWFRVDPPFAGRVVNIHPALLPKYGGRGMYGDRVHHAVLESGDDVSGCTVHIVDEHYDHGPNVVQRTCPVLPGDDADTLAARVFEQECEAYPEAVRMFAGREARSLGPRA